jgi:hypothetical protein
MPFAFPMLADFALRLACGLAVLLLATPWRLVPPPFFRTHCLVILGLLVLAGLDLSRAGGVGPMAGVVLGAAVLAYFASVAWGLGLPRLSLPLTVLVALASAGVLVDASRGGPWELGALNGAGRLVSALLMGSTLTAMLLGHYYLTAPAMSIEPLKRFVRAMAGALGLRALLAIVGWWVWQSGHLVASPSAPNLGFFLAMRWGMGIAGPGLATYLTGKTVEIRSTQSATGILYIAMALVLIGELTALGLSREVGVIF